MIVLLAEDDKNDVFLIQRALTKASNFVAVYVVENGEEVIQYLNGAGRFADRKSFPLPSLILLDIRMPLMSGIEALRWIRNEERFAALPVIIITSSLSSADRALAWELNCNSYLSKHPLLQLPEVLSQNLQYWLKHNLSPDQSETDNPEHQ